MALSAAGSVALDVRYALRAMRRQPGFMSVAVLTLALGIGANTAIFGVLQAVLLAPLPYSDPGALVSVMNRWDGSPSAALSNPEYLDYAERSRSLVMAAMATTEVNISGGAGDPERVSASVAPSTCSTCLVLRRPLADRFIRTRNAPAAGMSCCCRMGSGGAGSSGSAP